MNRQERDRGNGANNNGYYPTEEALRLKHGRLFRDEPVYSYIDRPVGDTSYGLAEATLRFPVDYPDVESELVRAFARLQFLYGPGSWDVTITANVILRSSVTGDYGVFYGQDYGVKRDLSFGDELYVIERVGQVAELPTLFHVNEFEEVFFSNFTDSAVMVDRMVSIVYMARRMLSNFDRAKRTDGKKMQSLF